jgi:hypothetical protein
MKKEQYEMIKQAAFKDELEKIAGPIPPGMIRTGLGIVRKSFDSLIKGNLGKSKAALGVLGAGAVGVGATGFGVGNMMFGGPIAHPLIRFQTSRGSRLSPKMTNHHLGPLTNETTCRLQL